MRMHDLTRVAERAPLAAWGALVSALVIAGAAWAADVFEFIPAGGRTLLSRALANRTPDAEVSAVLTGKRSRDEWLAHLRGRNKVLAGLQGMNDKQLLTLADYLAFNMPQPALKPPAPPSQANWEKALPPDGRDLALEYCQGCHIITVVVTQDRTKDAWLGSLGKPSHVRIRLRPEQRQALVSYLVLNAAIPIDDVPEPLRAGGATY